jgi:hypothetical protein
MNPELVDKVAAAIMAFEYSAEDYPYALTDEAEKNQYRGMARAAIQVVLDEVCNVV